MIPENIRKDRKIAESFINSNPQHQNEIDMIEIGTILFEIGQMLYLGNNNTIYNIKDHYYAIKYLKAATSSKQEKAANIFSFILVFDKNQRSQEIAFQIACFYSDFGLTE